MTLFSIVKNFLARALLIVNQHHLGETLEMGMRVSMTFWCIATLACGGLAVWASSDASAQADGGGFVAGTTPSRRPDNAPTIKVFEKSDLWKASARAGISDPLPPSLKFLDDQGGWFTPFTRPNMPGLYDIRGLYAKRAASSGGPAK